MKRTLILILGLFLVACGAPAAETAVVPPPATNQTVANDSENVASSTQAPVTDNEGSEGAATNTPTPRKTEADYADLEIITLLPRDGIPAIDNPEFITIDEADEAYDPDELVIGVAFNGEARAYSVPLLSNHEIVNDTVGGEKIAVTW